MKRIVIASFLLLLWSSGLEAQAPFYQGKPIKFVAGFPAGVAYDIYARLTAQTLKVGITSKTLFFLPYYVA